MPFEDFDKKNNHIGFTASYFEIFQKELLIPMKIIKTQNINQSLEYLKQNKCDVAICGHIHKAEIKDGYMNSGDWCESCTALVEDLNGVWTIIDFHT